MPIRPATLRVYRDTSPTARITFPFSRERVVQIRKIVGRRWCPDEKCWEIPDRPGIEQALSRLFPNDRIEFVDGSPHSGTTDLESAWMTELKRELRLRGFRAKTRKAYTGHARRLVQHFERSPEQITEDEIRDIAARPRFVALLR